MLWAPLARDPPLTKPLTQKFFLGSEIFMA